MRKEITIAAEPRDYAARMKPAGCARQGSAPAVLYGAGGDAVAVAINPKEINRILHSKTGHNTIFDIAREGRRNHAGHDRRLAERSDQGNICCTST